MFKSSGIKLVFVLFVPVLIFTLFYFHFFGAFLNSSAGHSLKNIYFSILTPAGSKISALFHFPETVKNILKNKNTALRENENLRNDLKKETLEKNLWKEKAISLMRFATFQSWLDQKDFSVSGMPAQILTINSSVWLTSFSINKGTQRHVKNGNAVLALNGFAGRVTESFNTEATVMLITHPSSFTGVRAERTREVYLLSGTGSGCILQFVPPDADIRKGDKLITSGLSQTIPAGIPVGVVENITHERNSERVILVKPYVNFRRIEQVFVLLNKL